MSGQISFVVDDTFGCHIWTGKLGNNGRPIVWRGRKPISGYQYVYELEVGPVPEDRVLDHLCRRATCVYPEHLEPVTQSENERRKTLRYRLQRRTCSRGHVLNETNRMLTPEGGVLCRQCRKDAT